MRDEAALGRIAGELGRLHSKVDALSSLVSRSLNDRLTDREETSRYQRRVKALERETERLSELAEGPDWKRDSNDDTGVNHVNDLRIHRLEEEESRRRDSGIWWKRQRWLWIGGIATALLIASVTGCVTYAVTRISAAHGGK